MFEQIEKVLKEAALHTLSQEPGIAPQDRELISQETAEAILETMKDKVMEGNFAEITDLLSGKDTTRDSAIGKAAIDALKGKLATKLNVVPNDAATIAIQVVPAVLKKILEKTNDPTGQQFDLKEMISQVAGGNFGGMDIKSILSTLRGKPKD